MPRLSINGLAQDWPISTPFGSTDSDHFLPHKGVDFAIHSGTPIPSVGDGIVTQVLDEGTKSFGKFVKVHLFDGNDVIYGHLSSFDVKVGQVVHTRDLIGLSGSTGDSTGPHLHLQVMHGIFPVNPIPYAQNAGMIKGFGDKVIDAVSGWLHDLSLQFIQLLNSNSAEIVTFGIVVCGGMMMIAPLLGKSSGKWFGRAVGLLWIGAIWRLVL